VPNRFLLQTSLLRIAQNWQDRFQPTLALTLIFAFNSIPLQVKHAAGEPSAGLG